MLCVVACLTAVFVQLNVPGEVFCLFMAVFIQMMNTSAIVASTAGSVSVVPIVQCMLYSW